MSGRVRISLMGCVDPGRAPYELKYRWRLDDGGRTKSRRPKQKNDCTVRALALARCISYDDAHDMLAAAGRRYSEGFHLSDWLAKQEWAHWMSFPAVKGQRRMNPSRFVKDFPTGRYICRASRHVFAVIDGVVHDTFENRPDRCIYGAWLVTEVAAGAESPAD